LPQDFLDIGCKSFFLKQINRQPKRKCFISNDNQ
jgi:hypothetical protein